MFRNYRTLHRVLLLLFSWILLGTLSPAYAAPQKTTADHSKFKELQKDFSSGPEVTKACLSCHTEAAKQIHNTKHWSWEFLNPDNQQKLGKKNVLNNFCIAPRTNYAFCTTCHVGYGWKDDNFDFTSEVNVDCLVCHDTTGTYNKIPGLAGHPAYKDMERPPGSGKITKAVNLKNVAQNIGKTSRDTCGSCHFYGGGGDGVKHGDMDSSLAVPERELDVHMDALGADFTCATCHAASSHDVAGSRYTPTAVDREGAHIRGKQDESNPSTCRSCHGVKPHSADMDRLNGHSRKVACQTCHIPKIARGGVATKMSWDWSTAGKMTPEGKPLIIKDDHGHVVYHANKGDFVVGENIIPEYEWFNGKVKYTLLGDEVSKGDDPTQINHFDGSPDDGASRIWPVKVFRGNQPYDPVNKTLLIPHTAGNDDTAYWKNYDWKKAITTGMADTGVSFSGEVDFIKTEMRWPITHMVAPKETALGCTDCHSENGRLANIDGIYMPATGKTALIDKLGFIIALLSLIGVLVHGAIRIIANRKGA